MRRVLALIAISTGYSLAIVIAKIFGTLSPVRRGQSGKVLVIGTFHNPNWFLSHITPLASCGVEEIIVVGDGYLQEWPNVRMIVPSPIVARLLSRSVAKLIWGFWCALKYRPDLYMGYAIFPAATWALVLARIFGRKCCFQLTSGKLELEGGGYLAENRLLSSLGSPSHFAERLAFALTRQMDQIIVRGSKAEKYVRDLGFPGDIVTITGSVNAPDSIVGFDSRNIDLIFVARLTMRKRPDRFVKVVHLVKERVPDVSAVIVGDGPQSAAIQAQIRENGLSRTIKMLGLRKDVQELVGRSRFFVLTSRWEGLSIALLEAMSAGAVPIASDVGDLADVVSNGKTGYLFYEDDIDRFADAIVELIRKPSDWATQSAASRAVVCGGICGMRM